MADLDGDGHVDLLSGSWPGELFFFRGGEGRTFAPPVKLRDKAGRTINVGGGRLGEGGLVAGDARFEEKDGKQYIVYEEEWIEVKPGEGAGITGTASALHACDWDGDGDLDLLVGNIHGSVHILPNEGKRDAPAFGAAAALEAGGEAIDAGSDAGPFAADWDADGDLDLLVGCGDGKVLLFRRHEGALLPGETLVPEGRVAYDGGAPVEPTRGVRAKVCAADWNGDGLLDLLLGDYATQGAVRPEPTPEERAKEEARRAELQELQGKFGGLIQRAEAETDRAKAEEMGRELRSLEERMEAIRSQLPEEYTSHGWVWLFVRKKSP